MNKIKFRDHHHYKDGGLLRSEKVERKIIEIILNSATLDSSESESSTVWELKHSSGCCQLARILAQKRNLNCEIAEVSALLHDIYVVKSGKYQDHAKLGAPLSEDLLNHIGGFTLKEIKKISKAIYYHSEKEIYTNEPYVELIKDVDVFDCSLYINAEGYYRLHKLEIIVDEYIKRIKKVRQELNLPEEPVFRQR